MPPPARSPSQRKRDTLEKLRAEVDLWAASAGAATARASGTARNLIRAGRARVAFGPTRDVVIVEGPVETIALGTDAELEDAHARATGFDPRTLADEYVYLRLTPHLIQAWREENELAGRTLMRDGSWLA